MVEKKRWVLTSYMYHHRERMSSTAPQKAAREITVSMLIRALHGMEFLCCMDVLHHHFIMVFTTIIYLN